jgi:hypothetical protein
MSNCDDCGDDHKAQIPGILEKLDRRHRLYLVGFVLSLVITVWGAFTVHPGWALVADQ